MHGHGRGSFTDVRRALWPRVILGYRLMGISACMAREGSFTHVKRVLRPRVGISACMVMGGGVLLMLGASTGQGLFWGRVYLGYLHAWPGKGVLLMLGVSSRPRAGISACLVTGGEVLLMLGASSGHGLF